MCLRWLFAAAAVTLAALWAFRHFRQQQQLAAQRLQEWVLAEELDERLDRVVELKFKRSVPPDVWLAEWSRQAGVPAHILDFKEDSWAKATEMPSLPPMTAGEALQTLCKLQDCFWSTTADREVVVHSDRYSLPKIVRT